MALPYFTSFESTVNPYRPANFPKLQRLLVDSVTGAPVGLQSSVGGPDGIWAPVDLTAAQIAAPTPAMIADLNASYRLNVAPYTRYLSNGATLVAAAGPGNFLPLLGGTMLGPIITGSALEFVPTTRTWAGTTNTQVPINAGDGFLTWNGTVPSNLGGLAPLWMTAGLVPNLNAAVTGGVVMDSLFISPGPATTGGVTGSYRTINIAVKSSNTETVEYVAARTEVNAFANDGGTALVAQGSLVGGTDDMGLYSGATYWQNMNCREFSLQAQAGSSVLQKVGTYTMLYAGDAVQGSGLDAAQGFWNQAQSSSTQGWQVLWNLGNNNHGWFNPLASNGVLMRFDPNLAGDTLTIGSLFELAGWTTVTGNIFNSVNFKVTGAGVTTTAASYGVGANKVVGPRISGWGTSTGGSRGAITGSSTLPQVAAALAQLLTDITTHGMIGA